MPIAHEHNLARPLPRDCQFGIRVKLRSTDPFKNLVGGDWTREHWYATREERDRMLKEMSGRMCTSARATARRWSSRKSTVNSDY